MLNRIQLRSRRAFRPFVRLDVFPGALRLRPARIIGRAETFAAVRAAQLPLPNMNAPTVELHYVPFEESA